MNIKAPSTHTLKSRAGYNASERNRSIGIITDGSTRDARSGEINGVPLHMCRGSLPSSNGIHPTLKGINKRKPRVPGYTSRIQGWGIKQPPRSWSLFEIVFDLLYLIGCIKYLERKMKEHTSPKIVTDEGQTRQIRRQKMWWNPIHNSFCAP
ncbi:hypothetical protein BD779DRAFT_1107702 [Infundibulicybe gibba]|nr:hypothetical protein BD779DRAFT_1107702 [Infundibulicybe gibba]